MNSLIYGDLPGAVFPFEFYNGVIYQCCVMRATFAFDEEGHLELLDDQPALAFGDQYDITIPITDENEVYQTTRDLLYVSDLTPYKPVTDVLVIGSAQAPGGKPAQEWVASVRLGAMNKTVRITGPRYWEKGTLGRWSLTKPEPVTSVPLLYSRAYGGRLRPDVAYADLKPAELDMRNPLGRGFEAAHGGKEDRYLAPQIEYPQSLAQDDPAQQIEVAGLSPMPGHFWSRLQLSGTYDKEWKDKVAPHIPLDMDLRYWNAAPGDQQVEPFLSGGETLVLDGLLASGTVQLEIPDLIAWTQVDDIHGKQSFEQMSLDTVTVDLDHRHLILRWNWVVQSTPDIRRISLHCPRQDDWHERRKEG
ncbi:DUF2169 domain-containing protein [Comamonas odontotermitis]|uniref:DUF2169 family type VI secretion system accessory protein n=1 Tax=Comamonas odontotermitis TaxID=379895 RepID=UPI00366BDA96